MSNQYSPLSREDYEEPSCVLCMDKNAAPIPQRRVREKLDEYMSRRDYAGAERHLNYWLREAQQSGDLRGEFFLRGEMMGHYRKTGNRDEAILSANEGLNLIERLGFENTLSAGTAYVNAATVYDAFGEPERSVELFERAKRFGVFFRSFGKVPPEERRRRGFVLLARPNRYPEKHSPFERIRDEYRDEAHIVYSMWTGYLRGAHADPHILRFMGDLPCTVLHTSGHAFPEDIARLIQTADPKIIVPMHTERAEEFASLELFAPWAERVRALQDGETLEI